MMINIPTIPNSLEPFPDDFLLTLPTLTLLRSHYPALPGLIDIPKVLEKINLSINPLFKEFSFKKTIIESLLFEALWSSLYLIPQFRPWLGIAGAIMAVGGITLITQELAQGRLNNKESLSPLLAEVVLGAMASGAFHLTLGRKFLGSGVWSAKNFLWKRLQEKRPYELIGIPFGHGGPVTGSHFGPLVCWLNFGFRCLVKEFKLFHGLYPIPFSPKTRFAKYVQDPQAKVPIRHLGRAVEMVRHTRHLTTRALQAGRIPITIGGDHSIHIGTGQAVLNYTAGKQIRVGVIHWDAHADIHDHLTSPSGNIHGMPLRANLGDGHPALLNGQTHFYRPEDYLLLGIRDLEDEEWNFIKRQGIAYLASGKWQAASLKEAKRNLVMELDALKARGVTHIHFSIDLDGFDPRIAKGVSTAVDGGRGFGLFEFLVKESRKRFETVAIDIVEYNPLRDKQLKTSGLINKIVKLFVKK